jgi:hypothetical protein
MASTGQAIYTFTYDPINQASVKEAIKSKLLSYGGGGVDAGGGRFSESFFGRITVNGSSVSISDRKERSPTGVEMGITTVIFPELYNTQSLKTALEGVGHGTGVSYSTTAKGGARRRKTRRHRSKRRSTHRRRRHH